MEWSRCTPGPALPRTLARIAQPVKDNRAERQPSAARPCMSMTMGPRPIGPRNARVPAFRQYRSRGSRIPCGHPTMHPSIASHPLRALCAVVVLALCACSPAAPGAPNEAAAGGAGPAQAARDPAAVRLNVRADGLPEDLRTVDAAATALARREDRDAILFNVVVRPRSNDPGKTASVTYSYYLPGSGRQVAVGFANMLIALPQDQVEAARRAGVLAMLQKSIDDASRPTVTEIAGRRGSPAPEALPQASVSFREAHAVALRAGLGNFDNAQLTLSARDPARRFAVWAFAGNFPGDDKARALYVDAQSGRAVAERDVYAATFEDDKRRASAELAASLDALRRRAGGGAGPGGSSCVDYCRESASQCRTSAYRSADAPSANAAASECTDAERRCTSTCP